MESFPTIETGKPALSKDYLSALEQQRQLQDSQIKQLKTQLEQQQQQQQLLQQQLQIQFLQQQKQQQYQVLINCWYTKSVFWFNEKLLDVFKCTFIYTKDKRLKI